MNRPGRRRTFIAVIAAALLIGLFLLLAMFPVSWAKSFVERRLSAQIGSPVTIGALEREDFFSFEPIIVIRDLSIRQVSWAGSGKLASVDTLQLRMPMFPLLIGRVQPQLVRASGIRLDLMRRADGRTNWPKSDNGTAGGGPGLSSLVHADGNIRYRDEKQRRGFAVQFRMEPRRGLVVRGVGQVDGNPVRLLATGGAARPGTSWPFEAVIDGAAVSMRARGIMAAPLQTGDMSFAVQARAQDLKLVDRIIEAGLFHTQPVSLNAEVRRTPGQWSIRRLTGTIGSSAIDGHLEVARESERTVIDGAVHSPRLDFEDLASDAGNRAAIALEQSQGIKIVPNLRLNIRKIDNTDGRITFRIDQIVSRRRPSSLRSASGVLRIDHRFLTIDNLSVGLSRGKISGYATVDQRQGQPQPTISLALDLRGSSIAALAGGGDDAIDAPVSGRVRLTGIGDTVREAVGRSSGRVGLFAAEGVLPEKFARLLGFDLGAIFVGKDEEATLRCAAIGLDVRGGVGRVSSLVADTNVSQSRGTGIIRFPEEALTVSLTGMPKAKNALRLPGSVLLGGSIREPVVEVPEKVRSAGNILKAIGRAITGNQGAVAKNADCAALGQKVLR